MKRDALTRAGRSLAAPALALGLFLLLSVWLARAASGRVRTPGVAPEDFPATLLLPDPRVAALLAQVTTETLAAQERALTGQAPVLIGGRPYTIATRYSYSGEPISQATRYVYERFRRLDLDVTFHDYTWAGNHWRNVVAERRGLRRADQVYLVTAHLDDLPSGPVAPGADDNASGSAAVLLAAELLGRVDLDATLRFVLFTGEEQFLRGSAAYAADLAAAGEDVRGVLNLDMIGYDADAEPVVELYTRSSVAGSLEIAQVFSQVVAVYDLALAPEILVDGWLGNYSDNKSFWDRGYPAILAVEDWQDFNPHYHTTRDTLDHLDLDYLAENVRAGIGTLAHLGGLAPTGWLSGTVTDAETGAPLPATLTALAPARAYTTTTGVGGTFTLTLPVYTFTLQVQADPAAYRPLLVTDVAVLTDTVTVRHLNLQPWPHHTFVPLLLKQNHGQ